MSQLKSKRAMAQERAARVAERAAKAKAAPARDDAVERTNSTWAASGCRSGESADFRKPVAEPPVKRGLLGTPVFEDDGWKNLPREQQWHDDHGDRNPPSRYATSERPYRPIATIDSRAA